MRAHISGNAIGSLTLRRNLFLSVSEYKKRKIYCLRIHSYSNLVPLLLRHQITTDSHHIPSTRRAQTSTKTGLWPILLPKSYPIINCSLSHPGTLHKIPCNPFITFWVMLPTDRQTDRQADRKTNKRTHATGNLILAENKVCSTLAIHENWIVDHFCCVSWPTAYLVCLCGASTIC